MDSPDPYDDGRRANCFSELPQYSLDTVRIDRGMMVEALNGRVGVVEEVLFDAVSRRITHVLVRKGDGLTRDALVPVEWISRLYHGYIHLAVRLEQVDAFADRPSDHSESEDESPS